MTKLTVLKPILHGRRTLKPGADVEIEDDYAAQLLHTGHAGPHKPGPASPVGPEPANPPAEPPADDGRKGNSKGKGKGKGEESPAQS